MTKKDFNKILKNKLELFKLNKDTKDIWLVLYNIFGESEAKSDIAESESELKELIQEHEQFGDDYRIIKLTKGE